MERHEFRDKKNAEMRYSQRPGLKNQTSNDKIARNGRAIGLAILTMFCFIMVFM